MKLQVLFAMMLAGLALAASPAGAQAPAKAPAILHEATASQAAPEARNAAARAGMTVAELEAIQRKAANRAQGVLWPGESTTFRGATLTWKVAEADKTSSSPLGHLVFKGPGATLPPVSLGGGMVYQSTVNADETQSFIVYLDDTVFSFDIKSQIRNGNVSFPEGIKFQCYPQPASLATDASPFALSLYLSNSNPLRVGTLKISLSDRPVNYPDGTKHYQLRMQDADRGTSVAIPAETKSERQIGRYKVMVGTVYQNSMTVNLQLRAEADSRPQGADSYGNILLDDGEPIEKMLNRLAEEYKFSVEWVAFPAGHPESIDFAKKSTQSGRGSGRSWTAQGILKNTLEGFFSVNVPNESIHALALEWTDPAHLRVWARNYDKIVAQNEQEKKENEARAADLKMMKSLFSNSYTADTKVWELKKLSAVTAKALVEPELMAYFLIKMGTPNLPDQMRNFVHAEGKYYSILGVNICKTDQAAMLRKEMMPYLLDSSQDSVAADERTNALIMRIAPATKKVREIIDTMDNMMAAPKTAAAIEQYRIEVILLAGVKEEATAGDTAVFNPNSPVIHYEGKDYVFENSAYSAGGDLLYVTYGSKDANTTVPQSVQLPVGFKGKKKISVISVQPDFLIPNKITVQYKMEDKDVANLKPAKDYGISPEDLKVMGFETVRELGRGMVSLAGRKDDLGKATVTLSDSYRCQLEYQDLQKPYLILRGSLTGDKADKQLLSNTLFLEKDKPALLGLTNLKEALILLVKQTK